MTELRDILNVIDELAPSHIAEEWDNPGLQVGHVSQTVKKVFVSVDPTLEGLRSASNRDSQLLLTHHPLIFRPISHLDWGSYPGNVIYEAFKTEIAIVAVHTNLDLIQGGVNDILADLFRLQEVELLQRREDLEPEHAGLGRIGYLKAPVRLPVMTATVKAVLGTDKIRVIGGSHKEIKRVAVVGGSGGGMVSLALEKGADLLITGDVSHHDAREAERCGLALIDGGHFHTEKAAITRFADRLRNSLRERGLDVTVESYKEERDPMRYE
jgi:dinuclear metal center YbgI/SA1388 family protein